VVRIFVAFVCVPFEVDFGIVVETFERNLRLSFTSSRRRFQSFSRGTARPQPPTWPPQRWSCQTAGAAEGHTPWTSRAASGVLLPARLRQVAQHRPAPRAWWQRCSAPRWPLLLPEEDVAYGHRDHQGGDEQERGCGIIAIVPMPMHAVSLSVPCLLHDLAVIYMCPLQSK
jgi:hypothetical protein